MAVFRRFCARRGTCAHVYSDNGTNLVGAANELKEIYDYIISQDTGMIHSYRIGYTAYRVAFHTSSIATFRWSIGGSR